MGVVVVVLLLFYNVPICQFANAYTDTCFSTIPHRSEASAILYSIGISAHRHICKLCFNEFNARLRQLNLFLFVQISYGHFESFFAHAEEGIDGFRI